MAGFLQRLADRGGLDELRAGAEDGDDFHDNCSIRRLKTPEEFPFLISGRAKK